MSGPKIHFSQSKADRLYSAEFDDALVEAAHWKNPRYVGSKLIGKKINKHTPTNAFINTQATASSEFKGKYIPSSSDLIWGGDITYGLNPVVGKETTAIYIANTVIGGTEKPKTFTGTLLA